MKRSLAPETDYSNLRYVSKQKQENIGLEFSEYVFKKIEVYKKLLQSNLFKNDESNVKLTLSNAFYSFCFNKDTAANILGDNDKSQLIVRAMALSLTEGGYVLKTVLNGFLKNRFQIELDFNNELQNFRGCSFSIQFHRLHFLSVDDTYIELFKHNIKDVKNSIGDDVQVAEQFILYIQESIPTAIFVVTFDPVLKYSIRRLFQDGESTAIYFFKENDNNQALEFIELYILQTTFN